MSLNPKLKDWKSKRIWIVGASSGIGEALARQFDALGAHCMLSARSKDKLHTLCAELTHAHALPLDVTDEQAVKGAFRNLLEQCGGIDLIVLLAGTYSEMSVKSFNLAAVKKQIDVNLNGTMHVLDAVLPTLIQQHYGHVSLVSSVAGYRGLPNSLAYGPSKAALINLAEALHLEMKRMNVGVSVVNPGFVDTPLTRTNTFPMPFLMTAGKAAQDMIKGYEKGQFELHFPKKFTCGLRLLRLLPYCLYFRLVKKITQSSTEHAQ
ncbi:MAG: SDR family NAD(P)-dependent oxidoreductase [Limnobacter sp.]|nr:SDR family NAD(P)-dependent oxidoreductase [Limnobacter sp.]